MAKTAGRLCVIKKNDVTIAGARNVGISSNGSPINVEDQSDLGYQAMLAGVLVGRSLELSIDGYEEDNILRDISLGDSDGWFLTDITFEFPDGDVISGDFVLGPYNETGAYEDGQTFSTTFVSDGEWTHTKAT